MKICTDVDLEDVIMDVKFKFEKFQEYWCHWGSNSAFPIDFACGPYHSAALPRCLWKRFFTIAVTIAHHIADNPRDALCNNERRGWPRIDTPSHTWYHHRRLADGTVHCAGSATYQICFRLRFPNPNPNPNPITDPNPNPKINNFVADLRNIIQFVR